MNTNHQKNTMQITTVKLIRWSGLSAMAAGIIFAGIQPIHPPDVLASVNTSAFIIITSLKTVMCLFGLFGIAGLYARQVEESGWLGLSGYLLLTIFYAVQMCFAFAEPLILPLLTTVAPTFVESVMGMSSGAGGPMDLGALAVVYQLVSVLYLLGLLLFGSALFRTRILSRWAAGLLALSGPLAVIMVVLLPHWIERFAAIPMGVALVWLGYALWSERRKPAAVPLTGTSTPQLHPTAAAVRWKQLGVDHPYGRGVPLRSPRRCGRPQGYAPTSTTKQMVVNECIFRSRRIK
ncbi:MAG: hypothetical protein R2932_29080 [Caldilineaceae bacterium]